MIKGVKMEDLTSKLITPLFLNSQTQACKDRLTVLVFAIVSGTLLHLVIGKSAKPRCFKNVKSLPTEYLANKKA